MSTLLAGSTRQNPANHERPADAELGSFVADFQADPHDHAARDIAFTGIVERLEGQLKADITPMVGPHRAEDVIQDTFINAFLSMDRFEGDGTGLAKWFTTIARNRARNALRDNAKADAALAYPEHLEADSQEPLAIANRPSNIGNPVSSLEFKADLAELQGMSARQYEILRLRGAGFSVDEISDLMDLPFSSVRAGIGTARFTARRRIARAAAVPDRLDEETGTSSGQNDSRTLSMV